MPVFIVDGVGNRDLGYFVATVAARGMHFSACDLRNGMSSCRRAAVHRVSQPCGIASVAISNSASGFE